MELETDQLVAGFGDLPRVSFEGLTPHEAAIAFVERKAAAEKMASALRELEALA